MEYKNLGSSGLQVSVAGLGCNNFGLLCDIEQSTAVVRKALELGINFFDTADIYGGRGKSEEILGQALGAERRNVIVATKFGGPMGDTPFLSGASRRYIMSAVDASLRRLGTDYIDLYQVHFPDARTPLEETMRALDDLVRAGKVRYVGCSNFAGWQVADAQWIARDARLTPLVSAQNQYNLLDRRVEQELVPACRRFGLGVLPYFPLASGFLSGKYERGKPLPEGTRLALWGERSKTVLTDRNFDTLDALRAFAEEHGYAMIDVAIGWLANQPHVSSVIAGATRPEQVEANVRAAGVKFSADELAEVGRISAQRAQS